MDLTEELRSFRACCLFVRLLRIDARRWRPSLPSRSTWMPFLLELRILLTTRDSWNFTVIFLWKWARWSFYLLLFLLLALSEFDP